MKNKMITRYNTFLENINPQLHEEVKSWENPNYLLLIRDLGKKAYNLDKIKKRNVKEYVDNPELLSSDIALISDNIMSFEPKGTIKNIPSKVWSDFLRNYIKVKTCNKLAEILYGDIYTKNSSFNPFKDNTEISFVDIKSANYTGTQTITRGQLFSDIWSHVDTYCNNAVELIETDTVEDLRKELEFNFIIAFISAIIIMCGLGVATGTVAAGTASGVLSNTLLSRIATLVGIPGLSNVMGANVTEIFIKTFKKVWTKFGSTFKRVFTELSLFSFFNYVGNEIIKDPSFIEDTKDLKTRDKVLTWTVDDLQGNKERSILEMKRELENHSSFYHTFEDLPTSLFKTFPIIGKLSSSKFDFKNISQTNVLSMMPGWKEWKNKKLKSRGFEKGDVDWTDLGYTLTYYISLYVWNFKEHVAYLNFMLQTQESLKTPISKM